MTSHVIGRPFGQKEELSNRIRQILTGYDTEAHIFTEMIQNADDAGASEIRFIVDSRQLSRKNVFGKCYEMLQGPALCCWNNAIFTEADYKGIVSLGRGGKETDLNKTGRFGVGINSQYHITDAIQFVSNEDTYVILDPLHKHHPDTDSSNPGRMIDVKDLVTGQFKDVLSGFNFMPLKHSTMFRLSLRSNESVSDLDESNWLSKQIHSAPAIKKIMMKFASTAYETLFFVKNIRKILFYDLDENNNPHELTSYETTFESKSDEVGLKDFWHAFVQTTKTDRNFRQTTCRKFSCNLNIKSST